MNETFLGSINLKWSPAIEVAVYGFGRIPKSQPVPKYCTYTSRVTSDDRGTQCGKLQRLYIICIYLIIFNLVWFA